jgi:hypothetical protein
MDTDPLGLFAIPMPPTPMPTPGMPNSAQQELNDNAAQSLTKWWSDTSSQIEFNIMVNNPVMLSLFMCASRSARWSCTASCNVTVIDKRLDGLVPPRATGTANGSSLEEACRNAKRAATQSAPSGTYTRHCQCKCDKG